jgi:hypothetical protein
MTRKMTGVGARGALSFTALHAACSLRTQRLSDGNEVDARLVRGLTGASMGSGKVSQSVTPPPPPSPPQHLTSGCAMQSPFTPPLHA